MKLVAPTTVTRHTVSTSAVEAVPSEPYQRKLVFLPPASPQLFWAIDEDGDAIADCRTYKWSPMSQGYPFDLEILPGQFVWVIADTAGQAPLAVICHYIETEVVKP